MFSAAFGSLVANVRFASPHGRTGAVETAGQQVLVVQALACSERPQTCEVSSDRLKPALQTKEPTGSYNYTHSEVQALKFQLRCYILNANEFDSTYLPPIGRCGRGAALLERGAESRRGFI